MSELTEDTLCANPVEQFAKWFEEAKQIESITFHDAVCLSTISKEGYPEGRIVLLKGFDKTGFRFFTNSNSCKGQSLAAHPQAALTHYWDALGKQVRIEGRVEMLAPEASDEYFSSRPRDSKLGAWASEQSQALESRATLVTKVKELEKKFEGQEIPRPLHWNGYELQPRRFEFWTLGEGRLHDRFEYVLDAEDSWKIQRLNP